MNNAVNFSFISTGYLYISLHYQKVIVLLKITGGTFSNIGPVLLNKAGKSTETDFENDYGK